MAGPSTADLLAYAVQAAQKAGIDPGIFVRQINQESGFDPNARSKSGAVGIAQLMPQYYPGVDPTDPYASLDAAAQTDATNLKKFNGRYDLMLAAYDAGADAVEKAGGVPDISETKAYVHNIMGGGETTTMAQNQDSTVDPLTPDELQQIADQSGRTTDTASATPTATNPTDTPINTTMSQQEWVQFVQQHKGYKVAYPIDPVIKNDPLGPNFNPNEPIGNITNPSPKLRYQFNDNTYIIVKFNSAAGPDGGWDVVNAGTAFKPEAAAAKPSQVGTNTKDKYIVTRDASGNLSVQLNPNYDAGTVRATPTPAANWQPIFDPSTGDVIAMMDPATGKMTRTPSNMLSPKTITDSEGLVRQWNPDTRTWDVIPGQNNSLRKLQIAKAQQDLLPKQQQLIDGAFQTIENIKQKIANGEIQPADANQMMKEVWNGVNAGLQGTTIFEQQQAEAANKRALATEGGNLLRERISAGTNMADSILRAAVGHVLLQPGQTTLGINPLSMANEAITQFGGGPQVTNWARQMLMNAAPPGLGGTPQQPSQGQFPMTREDVLAQYPELGQPQSGVPTGPNPNQPHGVQMAQAVGGVVGQ